MEERARESFKAQFIKLTLLLNAIVLFVAIGAFVLIVFRSSLLGIGVGLALLALGAVTFVYFSRLYQETKEWLEAHSDSGDKPVQGEKH